MTKKIAAGTYEVTFTKIIKYSLTIDVTEDMDEDGLNNLALEVSDCEEPIDEDYRDFDHTCVELWEDYDND